MELIVWLIAKLSLVILHSLLDFKDFCLIQNLCELFSFYASLDDLPVLIFVNNHYFELLSAGSSSVH